MRSRPSALCEQCYTSVLTVLYSDTAAATNSTAKTLYLLILTFDFLLDGEDHFLIQSYALIASVEIAF